MISRHLENYINKHELEGKKLAVACSAGLDSMSLLNALLEFYPKNLIYCVHLDHGLRDDSYKAVDFLQGFCAEKEIELISYNLDYQLDGDENSAREARYQFFEKVCKKNGIENILLAHNLNDQVETVLFRIFRGTSSFGLQGIPLRRKLGYLTIHRPLLDISREDLASYVDAIDLKFIEDSSNSDTKYARNLIRSKIIPQALKINPAVLNNVEELASIIKEEQEYLASQTQMALTDLGELPWDLASLRKLEPIILRRVIEERFTKKLSFVSEFLAAIQEGGFHRINFAKDKFFTIKQKQLLLEIGITV